MTYPDLSCQNTLTTHYRHITTADTRQMHMHYTIKNKKARRLHYGRHRVFHTKSYHRS